MALVLVEQVFDHAAAGADRRLAREGKPEALAGRRQVNAVRIHRDAGVQARTQPDHHVAGQRNPSTMARAISISMLPPQISISPKNARPSRISRAAG